MESFQIDTEEEIVEKSVKLVSCFRYMIKTAVTSWASLFQRVSAKSENIKALGELLHQPISYKTMHGSLLRYAEKKIHMAIVIDEYGRLAASSPWRIFWKKNGVIYDEFDAEEEPEIEQMDDNLWRFPEAR